MTNREDIIRLARECGFSVGIGSPALPKFTALIEKAMMQEKKRLDWIERQDLQDLAMGLVVDAAHDGEYFVNGDDNVPYYGKTLREAIDNAIRARKDNT